MIKLFRLCLGLACVYSLSAKELRFYVGTLGQGAQGILMATLESETGKLSTPQLIAEVNGASFLALSRDERILYATLDLGQGAGGVGAFQLRENQPARLINIQPSEGKWATHVALDREGKVVFVANYGSGSIASFPLNADGSLRPKSDWVAYSGRGYDRVRQEAPHPHGVFFDAQNRYLYVPDLGLDRIHIYAWQEGRLKSPTLGAAELAPGSGPRHLAFHPFLPMVFVVNELTLTVAAMKFDSATGQLSLEQVISSLPEGVKPQGATSSAIFCSPNGKNLYVANRGHDSLAVYAINAAGQLTLIQQVLHVPATPRGFGLSPDGRWLVCAGQNSGTLRTYRIDPASGKLSETSYLVVAPGAACVVFSDFL